MFDHLGIVVSDLKAGAALYQRMLAPLGYDMLERHSSGPGEGWVVFSTGVPKAPFFVVAAGRPTFWPETARVAMSPVHVCFTAPSRAAVDQFHAAGLAHGARCNGPPGIRRAPFYDAFLLDPDKNNIEAGLYLAQ